MKLSRALAPTLFLLSLPLGHASGQAGTGGFKAGDLYLYSTAIDALSAGGAIVHIDPGTGQTDFFLDLPTTPTQRGVICYDPYRDRLVFYGGFVGNHAELYTCDAAGNTASLGFVSGAGPSIRAMAPRGDGKIYCVSYTNSTRISYLDENNAMNTLLDASGAVYTAVAGGSVWFAHYDASTNQLILAGHSNSSDCPTEVADATNVFALQLSADGTRVLSEGCFNYEAQTGFQSELAEGISQGPNGTPLLFVSSQSSSAASRVARLDLDALNATPYSSNEYQGAGVLHGGTYSHVLGKAVILDTFHDVLRAYGPGEAGAGTILAGTGLSYPGTSSEIATLIEVVPTLPVSGLTANATQVSLSAGGTQTLSIDFGAAHASQLYLVLGSASGWTPGLVAGAHTLYLNVDNYFLFTLFTPNAVPLAASLGFLDGAGRGTTNFTLPAGTDPTLAGALLHHAASALDLAFVTQRTSNPVPVALVP